MKSIVLILLSLLSFKFISVARCDESCTLLFLNSNDIVIPNQYLSNNRFNTSRDLGEYWRNFSFSETESLRSITSHLSEGSTWIDMGAGHAKALKEGLFMNPHINGVAIGFVKPKGYYEYPEISNRFTYMDGEFVENMYSRGRLSHLKNQTELITDYYGPLSYSENLPLLFQIYFDLLKPSGVLVFHFDATKPENQTYFKSNSIRIQDRLTEDGIIQWLRTIPGIQVIDAKHTGRLSAHAQWAIKIKKINSDIVVPNTLITTKYTAGSPPKREFDFIHQ